MPRKPKPKPKPRRVCAKSAPKPIKPKSAPPSAADRAAGQRHGERTAARQATISRAVRDMGPVRDIIDPDRRESCRDNPERFCLIYNAEAFPLPFCQDHRDAIARIKESFTLGALFAFAMDRGKGKTTLVRTLALWAVSYGYLRYLFTIGANASKAEDNLSAIKAFIRFLPVYREDFPEISQAAEHLAGIAQKATGQLCNGEPTQIEWSQQRIILPTVPPPGNWPKRWRLRADGMVPTSGSVIGASGLTGDGLRGSLITLSTGESLRPDGVLLDDPQTPESARSATQNATRLQLISADILGMAGPGKTISAVMPCTVIAAGDMVDQVLDRKKNPVWRGDRRGILRSLPKNMAAWDRYFEVYAECAQKEPPDYDAANAYYASHRAELDEGAEAAWLERKLPHEISAVQHAMHLYFRDRAAFFAEYMNQPINPAAESELPTLAADDIMTRVNRHAQGTAPTWANLVTAAIDCHQGLLYYCVCAWGNGFDGAAIDYGTWPKQPRLYFALRDAEPTLQKATGVATTEGALRAGLDALAAGILGKAWHQEAGEPLRVAKCLVDVGWKDEVVYRFCRESAHAAILLGSKGYGITAGKSPISEWKKLPNETRQKGPSPTWTIRTNPGKGRHVLFDSNHFKSFIADRLLLPLGTRSALTLFGERPADHRLFADHLTAETRVATEGRGRRVEEWSMTPGRDNHYLDVLVMNAVAASIQGVCLPGNHEPTPGRRPTLEEMKRGRKAA